MQQRGFTLIELIIVIVILGVLAVTAAPRFIDLQSDANRSTLEGVQAALQGGSQLVYAKSAIAGEQANAAAGNATSQVTISGGTVETDFGYPDADTADAASVARWVDLDLGGEWVLAPAGAGNAAEPAAGSFGITRTGTATIDFTENTVAGASCHVLFTEAADANSRPTVTIVGGSC